MENVQGVVPEKAEAYLEEMRGMFLQKSASSEPGDRRLRDVAVAFNRWASRQPVERLAVAYENLANGDFVPDWNELGPIFGPAH